MLVVGNSVSMSPGDGVAAYPALLEAELGQGWEVRPVLKSGATIDEFETEVLQTISIYRPDALVLQVGINECAPRPLGRRGRARLSRLRWAPLRARIVQFLHAYRPQIIRLRGVHQLTSLADFESSVRRVVAGALEHGSQVLILPITRLTRTAEIRTPFANREIARYNGALRACAGEGVRFVTEDELFDGRPPDDYCADPTTVHLSGTAHAAIAKVIHTWALRRGAR